MKNYIVPVAYYINESGSRGAWPEAIPVQANSPEEALDKAQDFLQWRWKDGLDDDDESTVAIWHMNSEDEEEGFIMGDPVEVQLSFIERKE